MSSSLIKICSKTTQHLRTLLRETGHKHILIGVTGGGCNGLKYSVSPESESFGAMDEKLIVDDLIVRVCGKSLLFLIGTEINWVTDAMGSRMEFINPNATSSCGCGETFNVKQT